MRLSRPFPSPFQPKGAAVLVLVSFSLAAGLIALDAGRAVRQGLDPFLYLVANIVVFVDALDLILRVGMRMHHTRRAGPAGAGTSLPLEVGSFTPYQMKLHLQPYALLVSLHDAEEILDDFLEAMTRYRDRLWVIDDGSTDRTWFKLQQAGVHAVRGGVNRKKPAAIKELLRQLPSEVATVIVLDPDVRILDRGGPHLSDLERVVFEFQRSGRAAAAPRVTVRPDGWLAALQGFEYALACSLGRKSLADHSITSGVAVYRRDALSRALESHTLSVYAEDLKNALILLGEGETIYYDDRLVIETEGKRTWPSWFSQRVGWSYGFLKVYLEHVRHLGRLGRGRPFLAYHYLGYMGVLMVPLQPLRVAALALLALSMANGFDVLLGLDVIPDVAATDPSLFLFAYLKYMVFAIAASCLTGATREEWLRFLPVMPVYFFYALVQIVPGTVGYLNWVSLRSGAGRLYRDHFEDEQSLAGPSRGVGP